MADNIVQLKMFGIWNYGWRSSPPSERDFLKTNNASFLQNLAWGKIAQNFKGPYFANSWSHGFHTSMIRPNSENFIEI